MVAVLGPTFPNQPQALAMVRLWYRVGRLVSPWPEGLNRRSPHARTPNDLPMSNFSTSDESDQSEDSKCVRPQGQTPSQQAFPEADPAPSLLQIAKYYLNEEFISSLSSSATYVEAIVENPHPGQVIASALAKLYTPSGLQSRTGSRRRLRL